MKQGKYIVMSENKNRISARTVGIAKYMREHAKAFGLNPDAMYAMGLLANKYMRECKPGMDTERLEFKELCKGFGFDKFVKVYKLHPKEVIKQFGVQAITPEYLLFLEADIHISKNGEYISLEDRLLEILDEYGKDSLQYKSSVRLLEDLIASWT